METLLNFAGATGQQESITLHTLVSRLVAGIVPKAVRNKCFLVNDIPSDLNIIANTDMVAAVLSNVLATVVSYATESCIRISAKECGNVVLVQLKDHHSSNTYTIAHNLQSAQPIAEKIGGYIGVTSQQKNEITIVFSFPNMPVAA